MSLLLHQQILRIFLFLLLFLDLAHLAHRSQRSFDAVDLLAGALKLGDAADHILAYLEDPSQVLELATVVGSREDGEKFSFIEKFISLLYDLVRPANEVKTVIADKGIQSLLAKDATDAALKVNIPAVDLNGWVGPQQVTD